MFSNVTVKDTKNKLGELIRLLRKRDGLTQQDLGEKLGLSRMTVQNLEAGRNGTVDTLFLVLQHFDLLGGFYIEISNQIADNSHDSLY